MTQKSDLDDKWRVQRMLIESIDGLVEAKKNGEDEEVQMHHSSKVVAYSNVLNVDLEEALEDRMKGRDVFQDLEQIPPSDH